MLGLYGGEDLDVIFNTITGADPGGGGGGRTRRGPPLKLEIKYDFLA